MTKIVFYINLMYIRFSFELSIYYYYYFASIKTISSVLKMVELYQTNQYITKIQTLPACF